MKKLMIMVAALAAVCLVSCFKETKNTSEKDGAEGTAFSIEKFTDSLANVPDSAALAGLFEQAAAEVKALVDKGDIAGANALADQVKGAVEANKEKLSAIVPAASEMAETFLTMEGSAEGKVEGKTEDKVEDKAEGKTEDKTGVPAEEPAKEK